MLTRPARCCSRTPTRSPTGSRWPTAGRRAGRDAARDAARSAPSRARSPPRPGGDRAAARSERPELQVEASRAGDELVERVRAGALHVARVLPGRRAAAAPAEGTERHELGEEPFVGRAAARAPARRPRARSRSPSWRTRPGRRPSRERLIYRACVAAGFSRAIRFVTRDLLAARGLVAAAWR